MIEDNVVLIGKKGVMPYVLAAVTQFSSGAKQVIIKARGRSISTAVDVAEVIRGRFVTDAKPSSVIIGTEEVNGEDGKKKKVSSIEIILSKA